MPRLAPSPNRLLRRILLGSLLAATTFSLLPTAASAQQFVIKFVKDPDPAPDFKLKDLDGNDLSLEAYKGKVILLNFWATWCGPCRAELPSLIELQTKYKDHLQIIGMDVDDDDINDVRNVIKNELINYPVAVATVPIRIAYGGIAGLPTVFVINPEGRVVQKHVGLFDPLLYETEVRALLNLPIQARVETFQDTGEIFLKHADRATMLPGVNTSALTPQQRTVAIRKFNSETCTCGCKYTLAQCRLYDPNCQISKDRTAAIVKEVATAPNDRPTPLAPPDSNTPATAPAPAATPPAQIDPAKPSR